MAIDLTEYKNYPRSELAALGVEWDSLSQFVGELAEEIQKFAGRSMEDPPFINNDSFWPGGWVGTYRPVRGQSIRIVSRLDGWEWQTIRDQVVNWLAIPTNPMVRTLFKFSADREINLRSLYLAYSKRLRALTEVLLTQSLPRRREITRYVGREIRGNYKPLETILHQRQAPHEYVSDKVHFELVTHALLLFTRFHMQLAAELNRWWKTGTARKGIQDSLSYHSGTLVSKPFSELLDSSIGVDLDAPELIEKARGELQRDPIFQDIIDLYEGFVLERSFVLAEDIKSLDAAIKPSSKVYELWCLRILLEELEGILGPRENRIQKLPVTVMFSNGTELHYDGGSNGVYSLSRITRQLRSFDAGSGYGRPDFLLDVNGEVKIIIDAKYKTSLGNLDTQDVQRFYSYLLDYMSPNRRVGILFHADNTTEIHQIAVDGNVEVHLIRLRPPDLVKAKRELRDLLQKEICGLAR